MAIFRRAPLGTCDILHWELAISNIGNPTCEPQAGLVSSNDENRFHTAQLIRSYRSIRPHTREDHYEALKAIPPQQLSQRPPGSRPTCQGKLDSACIHSSIIHSLYGWMRICTEDLFLGC
uniref:Uncharacterized protein n=1 Tax=Physcomitrium patens TaxID=3218 RepID=A0A2K1ITV2_PHYPA|nr:hypothetical protein PHYPA_024644 [Physcomitrium patens]